jgi:CHASE1-domain containing sensor protein
VFVVMLAALGIFLSIFAFSVVLGSERDRHRQDFEFKAAGRVAALQAEIDANVAFESRAADRIAAIHAGLGSNVSVALEALSRIVAQPSGPVSQPAADTAMPALLTLEWISLATAEERKSFEAEEPLKHFKLPFVGRYSVNQAALTFDLAFRSSDFAAMNDARNSGEPVASQRIDLVQGIENQSGFLVFVPVYQIGFPIVTLPERSDAAVGFVAGVFSIGDLLTSAWQHAGLQPLSVDNDLFLFDRSAPEGFQALLTPPGQSDTGEVRSGPLAFTDSLSVGGRTWEATITAPRQSFLTIWQPWSALLAGLAMTIIVMAYLLLAMQRESQTRLLVDQRTRELSDANLRLEEEILERSKAQQELAGLYDISRIFSTEGDFESKATKALEKLAVLANADWVTLRLPNDEEPGLHLLAASGPAVAEHPPVQVFTEAMTLSTQAFTEGRLIVIDNYAAQATAFQGLVDMGMQSMVILPVRSRERTLGIITVIS